MKWIGLIIGIALLLFVAVLLQPVNYFDHSKIIVEISSGSSTSTVERILEENEILRQDSSFAVVARILGLSKHIRAGKYAFSPSDNLLSILLKLKNGDVLPPEQFSVTFPEGTSIYKMGVILEKAGFVQFKKFQDLVKEGITEGLREKYWSIFKYIPSESLEGYLYPDTYLFYVHSDVPEMAEKMVRRFNQVVMPFWKKTAKDTKFNLHEILTLASIIEKEAGNPKERAIISSVYHNRMNKNMFLAACPTIKYALNDPTPKVYKWQLEVDSPYNTYKNKGLPPGPICNPGIESIKAAVYPAKTNYYYFVAKDNGSHIFSATWQEHQKARQKVSN